MKIHPFLLLLAMTVIANDCTASAQDDGRIFGNGRFLRRLRDRIQGPVQPPNRDSINERTRQTMPKRETAPTRADDTAGQTAARNSKADSIADGLGISVRQQGELLVIDKVNNSGPAADAGIQRGDAISTMGGGKVSTAADIREVLKVLQPGDQIGFEVRRNNQIEKVNVQIGSSTAQVDDRDFDIAPDENELGNPGFLDELLKSGELETDSLDLVTPEPSSNQNPSLDNQRIIEQQRAQIRQMQIEIDRLKSQRTSDKGGEELEKSVLVKPRKKDNK